MAATVRVSITGDTSGLGRATRDAEGKLNRLSRTGGSALRGLGTAAKYGGAALGVGLVAAAKGAVDEFREAAKATAQTNAVIKSTGGAANVSAKQVANLASALSLKAGVDDEVIQKGENLLLTFKDVRNEAGKGNDVFDRATTSALDMSVAMGKDLNGSILMVGKALNDPIRGLTAMGRAGVQFTDEQKEMIKTLVESGDKLGAQRIILKELESQFAGSAEAQADPFDKAKVAVQNLQEALGTYLAPALASAATGLAKFVTGMQSGTGAGGGFVQVLRDTWGVVRSIGSAFGAAGRWAGEAGRNISAAFTGGNKHLTDLARNAAATFHSFTAAARDAGAGISRSFRGAGDSLKSIADAAKFVGKLVGGYALLVTNFWLDTWRRTIKGTVQVIQGLARFVRGWVDIIGGILTLDFGKVWDGVKSVWAGTFKVLGGMIRGLTAPFREHAARAGGAISGAFRGAWNAVKGAFSSGVKAALSVLKGATAPHRGAAKAVGGAVVSGFNKAKDVVGTMRGAISSVLGVIRNAPGRAAGAMRNVASAIVGAFKGIGERLLSPVKSALNAVISLVNGFVRKFNDIFRGRKIKGPGPLPDINFPGISLPTLGNVKAGAPGAGFIAPPSGFAKVSAAGKKPSKTALTPLSDIFGGLSGRFGTAPGSGGGLETQIVGAQIGISAARGTKGTEDDKSALNKLLGIVRNRIKTLRTAISKALNGLKSRNKNTRKKAKKNIATWAQELAQRVDEEHGILDALAALEVPVEDSTDTGTIETGTEAPAVDVPADSGPTDTAPTADTPTTDPDAEARAAQAEARAAVDRERARISERGLGVLGSAAGIGHGRPFIVINTLHPGDPSTLSAIAGAATAGLGLQGSVISPRTPVTA